MTTVYQNHGAKLSRWSAHRASWGSFVALISHGLNAGIASFSQFLLARLVGAEGYGDYSYVLAWVSILAYFSALGFDVSLLRFVASYRATASWGLLKGVIDYAQRHVVLTGCTVAAAGIAFVLYFATGLDDQLRESFLLGFLLVPIWSLLWTRCSVSRAAGGILSAILPDRITRDGLLIVVLILGSVFFHANISAVGAMWITLIGSIVGLYAASAGARRLCGHLIRDAACEYDAKLWRRSILPLVVIGAVELFLNRTGVILVGYLTGAKEAGVFGLCFNIAFVIVLPRVAASTLQSPEIAALFAAGRLSEIGPVVARSTRWTLAVSVMVAVCIFGVANTVLAWFGEPYKEGFVALEILTVGQLVSIAMGSQLNILRMTGNEHAAAVLLAICAAVNVPLSIVLIKFWGLAGAAIGTSATLLLWNIGMSVVIWRRLRLLPGILEIWRLN